MLRPVMFNMTRKREGQPRRRRDTREHVALYFKAFNSWATGEPISQLRFASRDPLPPIVTLGKARSRQCPRPARRPTGKPTLSAAVSR